MDVLPSLAMWRVALLLVLFALAGCGGSTDRSSPTVVAAFYPLAWAAEQVAGADTEVVNLTRPGVEPHDIELSPRDVQTIRGASLVVYAGGGFQPAVEDAVADRDGPSLDVVGADRDPHVWLDPVRFSGVVRQIGRALDRARRADSLAEEVGRLDESYRRGLDDCTRRTLVTTHAAFGHLAKRYGLTQLALAGRTPETEPGPRELERLIDEVRASQATTVFAEPLVSDRLAQTVARETGATVAVLDPIEGLSEARLAAGEDYISVMRDNLAVLRKAFGCR
jgi:zinc transport system substrate-binding protein